MGEQEQAASLYPTTSAFLELGAFGRPFDGRLACSLAGIAAAAAGSWEMADHHFHDAQQLTHKKPSELADLQRLRAQALVWRDSPGDKSRARELLTEAVARYRQMGRPWFAHRTEEFASSL